MASKDNASNASSDTSRRPITRSRSKEIQSEEQPTFEIARNIWERISRDPKAGVVIKENPTLDKHTSASERPSEEASQPNVMLVMMADVGTSEERMAELEKKVNMLLKAVEERDYEIASLKNHIESRDAVESSHTPAVKNNDKEKKALQDS